MDDSRLAAVSLLVALLLVGLVWYPATLSSLSAPSYQYEHRVDPAGTEAYEQRHAEITEDGGDLRTVQYESLSSDAQRLFDRTLRTDPGRDGGYEYEPEVCEAGVAACPLLEREDLADELHYDRSLPAADAALIVETEDGRYLFSTFAAAPDGHDLGGWPGTDWLVNAGVLLPLAATLVGLGSRRVPTHRLPAAAAAFVCVLLAGTIARAPAPFAAIAAGLAVVPLLVVGSRPDRRVAAAGVALGLALAVAVVAPAYLEAYGVIDSVVDVPFFGVLGLAWGGALALLAASWLLDDPDEEVPARAVK